MTSKETAEPVRELWAIFKRSIPNITMASAVLGSIENYSYPALIKLGFKRLIQRRTSEEIKNAQDAIRRGILDQLQYINIDD